MLSNTLGRPSFRPRKVRLRYSSIVLINCRQALAVMICDVVTVYQATPLLISGVYYSWQQKRRRYCGITKVLRVQKSGGPLLNEISTLIASFRAKRFN